MVGEGGGGPLAGGGRGGQPFVVTVVLSAGNHQNAAIENNIKT